MKFTILKSKRNGFYIPELKTQIKGFFRGNIELISRNDWPYSIKDQSTHETNINDPLEILKEWWHEISKNRIEYRLKRDSIKAEKLSKLIYSMDIIPATVENISLILEWLNNQNWGSWQLLNIEGGYKAAQHNCGGKLITTIELNKPILHRERMVKKFKSGHKTGYLNKYETI